MPRKAHNALNILGSVSDNGNVRVIATAPTKMVWQNDGRYHPKNRWIMECKCGIRWETGSYNWKHGKLRGCNECSRRRKEEHPFYLGDIQAEVNALKKVSTRKGKLIWSLSDAECERLILSNCEYCGRAPMGGTNSGFVKRNGIDRVNNDLGYIIENCVPCCKDCNRAKRCMTLTEFDEWITLCYNTLKGRLK